MPTSSLPPKKEMEAGIPDEPQSISRGSGPQGRDSLAAKLRDVAPAGKGSVRSRTRREEVSSSGFWKQRQEPNQTAKSQRESFTMAPMVWQLLRRRLQDQQRSRNSSALKRATREKASRGLRTFALTADVKEAHRQVLIDPRDWHLLGCQSEPGAGVFNNTVGTFGITSASYYWSRVVSSIARLTGRRRGIWSSRTTTTWKREEHSIGWR